MAAAESEDEQNDQEPQSQTTARPTLSGDQKECHDNLYQTRSLNNKQHKKIQTRILNNKQKSGPR